MTVDPGPFFGLFLVAAFAFAGFYAVYRLLALVVGFGARVTRAPLAVLVYVGLILAAVGLASIQRAYATVESCESDATRPFLTATAALLLALAVARNLRRPVEGPSKRKAERAIQLLALLGLLAWPVVAVRGLSNRAILSSRSVTLGDLRTIVSGEAFYAAENGGFFDSLDCLQRSGECLPGYGSDRPALLDGSTAGGSRLGYVRRFRAGPAASKEQLRAGKLSPSSIVAWAVVAIPAPRVRGHCESFCTDSTGRICFMADGSEPSVVDGLCNAACPSLSENP